MEKAKGMEKEMEKEKEKEKEKKKEMEKEKGKESKEKRKGKGKKKEIKGLSQFQQIKAGAIDHKQASANVGAESQSSYSWSGSSWSDWGS